MLQNDIPMYHPDSISALQNDNPLYHPVQVRPPSWLTPISSPIFSHGTTFTLIRQEHLNPKPTSQATTLARSGRIAGREHEV